MGEAERHAIRLMRINKEVFGYKSFEIIDKRLFDKSDSYKDNSVVNCRIEFKDKDHSTSMFRLVEECVYIAWYNCNYGHTDACREGCDLCSKCFDSSILYCEETWVFDEGGGGGDSGNPGIPGDSGGNGGGDGGGSGGGDPDPCNGGGLIIYKLPPCDDGGGDPGWLPTVPEEIIPPSEEQLLNAIANKPFAFFKDIPCEVIKAWLTTAKHKVQPAEIDKLNTIRTLITASPTPFTPNITYEMIANVQKLDDAYSPVVNMDYFPVKVEQLPYINGARATPDQFLSYIRKNINNFVDTDYSEFIPYKWYGINDAPLWNSNNPIGAVIAIDIKGPDNGSVIVSGSSSDKWTFTTISEPKYGAHPVSGNRDFGYIQNPDGSYAFYTRGVDRLTSQDGETLRKYANNFPFNQADALWKSFQKKINDFVNHPQQQGLSTISTPQIHRPNWSKVMAVMNGNAPLSDLSKDCP